MILIQKKRGFMEKKDNFLSKISLIDYTNKLEKVLDKKNFSVDAKNLLLSMLYKIENSGLFGSEM